MDKLLQKLQACIDDPMWPDHAEISKATLREVVALLAPPDAARAPVGESAALGDVRSERERQQAVEGWTPEHDDEHDNEQMAEAAACYATSDPTGWPWDAQWWKPKDRRRNLVKAGALILAEIERLDRAAERRPS